MSAADAEEDGRQWVELATVFAPLLMTFILSRGTGQRMAASRPQYADYAARTSGLHPAASEKECRKRRPGGKGRRYVCSASQGRAPAWWASSATGTLSGSWPRR